MRLLGIDEAGRGPVIGPLAIAGVVVEDEAPLIRLGVKDSKQLTPEEREKLFDKIIKSSIDHSIALVVPEEIDAFLSWSNLNRLEAHTMAKVIAELKPDSIILDLPGRDPSKYLNYMREKVSLPTSVTAENKADERYPVVSAASILAKVARDREIEKLKSRFGVEFGSGYPADPMTKAFLKERWDDPKLRSLFRTSWEPWKELKRSSSQSSLDSW